MSHEHIRNNLFRIDETFFRSRDKEKTINVNTVEIKHNFSHKMSWRRNARNAKDKEVKDEVEEVWLIARDKPNLILDTDFWVSSVKHRLDPYKVSNNKIIGMIDRFLVRKQEQLSPAPTDEETSFPNRQELVADSKSA